MADSKIVVPALFPDSAAVPEEDFSRNLPAPTGEPTGMALVIERLASNPQVDVTKLEKLIELQERMLAHGARSQFHAAMSEAQKEMKAVAPDLNNPQTRSRYASYRALDDALRPVYTKHGFALSFNTGRSELPDHVLVLCDVSHAGGHDKPYRIDMPADGKGAKGGDAMTKTHATGSAVSYGMRYLLKMIFNVAVGEDDDDGNRAGRTQPVQRETPNGYDDWLLDLSAVSETGLAALQDVWKKSRSDYRKFLTETDAKAWEALKAKAAKVKAVKP